MPLRILLFCLALGGCAHAARTRQEAALPAGVMRGQFIDDYGNAYSISDTLFAQLPHGRFHLVEWHAGEQFVVAQNDAANANDAGLWTRIDWIVFTDMAPYTWGFCLTAYRAPTRELARETPPPNRLTPRTGCNGFPFSRMRTVEQDLGNAAVGARAP